MTTWAEFQRKESPFEERWDARTRPHLAKKGERGGYHTVGKNKAASFKESLKTKPGLTGQVQIAGDLGEGAICTCL